ncbi:kinase-like protein [Aureobasidium pullulans]|nr:kinase-like protein [Aureobasidium pullulans]THX87314.1 kinase-like protein [Aureobasidium pullulans]
MGYSSASEGEIVQDKATRSRAPPARDSAIDRRSRPRSPPSRYNDRPRNNQHSNSSSSSNKRPYAHRSNQYPDQHTYSQHSDPHAYSRYPDERHFRYNQEPPEKRHRPHRSPSPARQRARQPSPPPAVLDEPEEPAVDEAKLIEDRRKRREALRAKHRGQPQPLLQQALHVATPSESDSVMASPGASLPSSPASAVSFSITNDQDLANPVNANPDSPAALNAPSAADYDPTMDMQEDRLNAHLLAATYDETKDKDPEPAKPQAVPEELDMFADEENDDMFALEPATGHKKDDGTQAVRIPEAKQLDRSMLDDWDDPEGYYRIILGELLDDRYHVQTNLGKGVFSAVVRALDATTNRTVAIKIIRTQESMYKAGMKEIEILQKLAEADPEDKKHIIRLERHFEHKGHLCMVFENLSINLREVLKKFGRDIGINIIAVRQYALQMFLGLTLLKKCEILHADLKPDNVLVNEKRNQLKIADLGSAMSADDNDITDALVSRFYRAPEIMLGIKHDYAIDMWSIGCTLFELYTGKICFTGSTNNQMLKGILECRGKIPNRMLKRSEFWSQHFEPDGTFLSQEIDNITRREVVRRMNITRTVPAKELKARLFASSKGLSPADAKELNLFADLLDKCLAVDPVRRISPTDALKHPFILRPGPVPPNNTK